MDPVQPEIRFAWLIPSYACNKRCSFCYNGTELLEDKSKASREQADRMLQVLTDLAVEHCVILGGEPLIYPHLEHLVGTLQRNGTRVSLVTNGLQFARQPKRTAWLADAGVESIMVSLEAPKEAAPAQTRADGKRLPLARASAGADYATVIDALDHYPALPIKYVVKLFKDSVATVPALIDRIARGVHKRVMVSFGTAVMAPQVAQVNLLNPHELASWYERIEAQAAARQVLATFYMNLPLCTFSRDFLERVIPDARGTFGCSLLRGDSIVLDHYGQMSQCTHFMPLATDNVFDAAEAPRDRLQRIWHSGEAAKTREALAVARHPACTSCVSFQRNCWGGCPILWSHFDPDDFIARSPADAS